MSEGMTLDRHAAERRRFAQLLGIHGGLGSGLPIGADSATDTQESTDTAGPSRDR